MLSHEFFPPGKDFDQAIEERFTDLYARAAAEFPASLQHSPVVGYALKKALDRIRQQSELLGSFEALLREQARDEMAGLMAAIEPMVHKLTGRNKGMVRVADEVRAEVFLSLHRTRTVYDPNRGPFFAWLHGVVRFVAIRLLAKEFAALARSASGADPDGIADPTPPPDIDRDPIPSFEEILSDLSDHLHDETDRRILHLKFREGQPNDRIVAALNLNRNALYKRLERIRKQLAPLGLKYFAFD